MASSVRNIPLFDTLTTLERDSEGNQFSFGDFGLNIHKVPSRTRLHRHDFAEMFFFERGTGSHLNDFTEYEISAPSLVFVDAGHVHAWPDAMNLHGNMLSCDAGFALPPPASGQAPVLFMPPAPVVIPLDADKAALVAQSFSRIRHEWENRGESWLQVARACVQVLLTDARRAWARRQTDAPAETAATRLCREFLLLMEQHVNAAARPAKIAAALRVSADHLSATLRTVTGHTAQEHLLDRLMLEARRLLAHSRMDIAEIAYHLGYSDVSYFGRAFRRRCGCSPGQFRSCHPET